MYTIFFNVWKLNFIHFINTYYTSKYFFEIFYRMIDFFLNVGKRMGIFGLFARPINTYVH